MRWFQPEYFFLRGINWIGQNRIKVSFGGDIWVDGYGVAGDRILGDVGCWSGYDRSGVIDVEHF